MLASQKIAHLCLFISWRGAPFSLPGRNMSFPGNFGNPYKMAVSCSEGMETQVFKRLMIPNGNLMSLQ